MFKFLSLYNCYLTADYAIMLNLLVRLQQPGEYEEREVPALLLQVLS